ncbi:MAG TPA: hypothetical protein VF545_01990 [Thermoleophilaceae bacterium]|jgi:hypothetical protein
MHARKTKTAAAAAAATAALAAGVAGVATAGPASTDANGNFAVLDVDVSPPQAGTKAAPRGIGLTIHEYTGNSRNGSRSPYSGDSTIRLPRGLRSNAALFPSTCPLPVNTDQVGMESRCPASSKIGSGTAEADARPTIQDFLPATVTAYNGERRGDEPTLILMIGATVGTSQLHAEVDYQYTEDDPTGPYGAKLFTFKPVADSNGSFLSIRRLDLNLPNKAVKLKGAKGRKVRVHLFEAPTKCSKAWQFAQILNTPSADASLTAKDGATCAKADRPR